MRTRQWQRLRLLWLAVAGLCVLRRGCLALGASVKLGTAASPCTTCSGFTDCTRLWPNLSKELVPATNRASIQNTLHKPRAGSSQGIIIKSMPQLHCAWLCVLAGGAALWACLCLFQGVFLSGRTAEAPMQCSPRSLMGWQRGSRSEPPITSGEKLAKWIGPCT